MPASLPAPPLPATPADAGAWPDPPEAGLALLLAQAARAHAGPVVLVAADAGRAQRIAATLPLFAGAVPVLSLPAPDTLPYEAEDAPPQALAARIGVLRRLAAEDHAVLVLPLATLLRRTAPAAHLEASTLTLRHGHVLDPEAARRRLEAAGYRRVERVAAPGEFTLRGGVVDVFPGDRRTPCRIRTAEGTVVAIGAFDPHSQRSLDALETLALPPACEMPLTDAAADTVRRRLGERFGEDVARGAWARGLREGAAPAGVEACLPLFFDATETLFDALPDTALLVLDGGLDAALAGAWEQIEAAHARARGGERPVLPPDALWLSPAAFDRACAARRRVRVDAGAGTGGLAGVAAPADADALLHALQTPPERRVLLVAASATQAEAWQATLGQARVDAARVDDTTAFLAAAGPRVGIGVGTLDEGLALDAPALALLPVPDVAPHDADGAHAAGTGTGPGLAGIAPGDPVVHLDSGVGRYHGLVAMEAGGVRGEFVAIDYAGEDRLYVPVTQIGRLARYAGTVDGDAPLHALGSNHWEQARERAQAQVRDTAAALLARQAQREARGGHAHAIDTGRVAAFARGFAFEETADQRRAIAEVLADLAAPRAMDRLVCGDVGFGKTEVALRAAFAVATGGRQVAVLVPTTLLAQQHARTFRERFAGWPIRVAELSRFRKGKALDATLAKLAAGEIDVVVGTHRLLERGVAFRDLGLAIVDEEQRFGVRQKERFRQLREDVDVLAMSATPIPRTLAMAMAGLRELSLIGTPPARRAPVRTRVAAWEPGRVRDALRRELARGGQAYVLHNDVDDIDTFADGIRALVPEARVAVAHAQMPAADLKDVMTGFHRRRSDVLVCTTIIEAGIDNPHTNTIVIDRADCFGLAQLQQLRGRVGRSDRRGHALLIVDPARMTADARRRLEAFAAVEELGGGFALASHDLEIRGAGELLGEAQSGQIREIGFDLYRRLLARAVDALRAGREPDAAAAAGYTGVEVEIRAPALIPDDYVEDVGTRLELYVRIDAATDAAGLDALHAELLDRFGPLPEPTARLLALAGLRVMAAPLAIARIDIGDEACVLSPLDGPSVDRDALAAALADPALGATLDGATLHLAAPGADADAAIARLRDLLARLGAAQRG
ncbi:transcription-repair coupling factor [Coralloluteibacterium stylophorae]|uniref:Transcription-repair-coupling factor n=1 Tax=Coralloluteibacterium stylophorae TaxID=1776034 RepID=A0A8J7VQV7_9GAMM|nr:transcription-repair coupling factor [Coralloluteibacterium stylophorae]MBS7456938.1 transcription-repair coupling factor [Coralloluteibacterium stylophorae]